MATATRRRGEAEVIRANANVLRRRSSPPLNRIQLQLQLSQAERGSETEAEAEAETEGTGISRSDTSDSSEERRSVSGDGTLFVELVNALNVAPHDLVFADEVVWQRHLLEHRDVALRRKKTASSTCE